MEILDEIISKATRITAEQERELFEKYRATKSMRVKTEIAQSQYAQVVNIAKKYATRTGADINELVSEGMIGLMRAIDIHNPEIGRLNTIAIKYIRGSILDSLQKMFESGFRRGSFYQQKLRKEAYEKVMAGSGIKKTAAEYNLTPWDIVIYGNSHTQAISLDELQDNIKIQLQIPGHYEKPDDAVLSAALRRDILKTLAELSPMQREVMRRYYGIGTERERCIDIAKDTGLSRSAASMKIKKALEVIRKKYAHRLKTWLEV